VKENPCRVIPASSQNLLVQSAQDESEDSKCEAGGEDPFETPSREQCGEAEHGNDFGDLAERHQGGGMFKAELLEVIGSVGIKCGERDAETKRR